MKKTDLHLEQLKQHQSVRENLIELKNLLKDKENIVSLKDSQKYSPDIFVELLGDEDPKIRKNSALILGMLDEKECVQALFEAYQQEKTLFVKSSYLSALAEYDTASYKEDFLERLDFLEKTEHKVEDIKHISEEIKALRKIIPGSNEHLKHIFHNPPAPVRAVLVCRKEVADKLMEIVSSIKGVSNVQKIFCGVTCVTTNIKALYKIRMCKEVIFPLNGMKLMEKCEFFENIIHGNLVTLLEMMHNRGRESFYFRIAAKDLDASDIAGRIQAMSGGRLINSVSDYEIEIRFIRVKDGRYVAFLKLFTLEDKRFAYRKNHVAASINPVNGAIVAELAKDYLKKDAQILDPFCGVGTMLIERNKIVPAKHIYGIDIYGKAIEGARENSVLAGMNINYINRNYFDFCHEYPFDEIISNLPEFKSREEADKFYGSFFTKSETILEKQGIIIIYSGEKNLIKKYLRLNNSFKLLREFAVNEKEEKYVFIIIRN